MEQPEERAMGGKIVEEMKPTGRRWAVAKRQRLAFMDRNAVKPQTLEDKPAREC